MSKHVVVCRVRGGIGNQLFTYSAARRLAIVNDMELVIDSITGFTRDPAYQRQYQLNNFSIPCRAANYIERLEPLSRIRRKILFGIDGRKEFTNRRYILEERLDFDNRLLDLRPSSSLFIEGYWQSAHYFRDVESTIRSDLKIKPPGDDCNLELAKRIRSTPSSVALHVRFFDKPSTEGSNNTPGNYYLRAIKEMEERLPKAHYFVFSDLPEAAAELIPLRSDRYTCISHNSGDQSAYADLWLMSLCNNFIIANSTFSWWGAWLSESEHKVVIAPGFEKRDGLSAWGFKGLIPDDWITI